MRGRPLQGRGSFGRGRSAPPGRSISQTPRHPTFGPATNIRPSAYAGPSAFVGPHLPPQVIDPFLEASLGDIAALIEAAVGQDPADGIAVPKNVKMEPPEAYKGQNDHNAFEKWLITLLTMMSLSNMGGRLQDRN